MSDTKQAEMKADIAAYMAKKDYYDVLGLPKSATDTDIKKAYRTLALRFHPDKNTAEGAKEVFKKVSNAYSVLINKDKKEHYDRFGPEEDHPGPANRRGHPQQDQEFDDMDDIFKAFFGGVAGHTMNRRGGGNFRSYSYSFGGNQGQGNQQQQQQQKGGINMSVVILVLFVIYTIAPWFKSGPTYAVIPSNDHKFKLKTSILQTDFFVTQQYFEQVKNPTFKRQSEMEIDREYLVQLEKKCEGKKREKRRLQQAAYRQSPGVKRENYLNQARAIDLSSCRTIANLNQHHEDYIRDLTYMK